MSIKAFFFDAGGATMGHGPDRNVTCLSGGVALLTPEGVAIATGSYGAKCVRELRDDEVASLVSALGIDSVDCLLKLPPDRVASTVADLVRRFGEEAGLAPLAAVERPARASRAR